MPLGNATLIEPCSFQGIGSEHPPVTYVAGGFLLRVYLLRFGIRLLRSNPSSAILTDLGFAGLYRAVSQPHTLSRSTMSSSAMAAVVQPLAFKAAKASLTLCASICFSMY
jgi:hypothetical protein